jgi:thiol:disulfide interchange protein
MKLLFWPTMVLAVALLLSSAALSQKPSLPVNKGVLEPISVKTNLYPANADAKKEIDEALERAAAERKRVLLLFGGNWCYDCHVLDRALHDGAAGKIVKEGFLLVHIDIGEVNKNLDLAKQYKIPLEKGVPAVAILGSDGKLLYSSGDGEFEAARRMMKKDLVAFLNRWRQ